MLENTPPDYRAHIQAKLALLPEHPGVYLHKNAKGEIIYIGKAISLKNRVRQYFQSLKHQEPKVLAMVRNVVDFDYILTETETEALTLESNLIKHHRPRYNILLKDDKHFPYVRIDMHDPYPRIEIVHEVKKDGAKYLGPYLSKYAVREAIETVRENFPIRTCKKDIVRAAERKERPCLNYYIERCIAPCTGNVPQEQYMEWIREVIDFLNGNTEEVLKRLHVEMAQASDEMAYEKAAMLRDRIHAIELMGAKQKAIAANTEEHDVFALAQLHGDTIVYALMVRNGKIIGAEHFSVLAADESANEIMASFIKQFYVSGAAIPKEIFVRDEPSDLQAMQSWLSQLRNSKVTISAPQRGKKHQLVEMAYKNACDQLERKAATKRREWERTEGAARELAHALGMDGLPDRMECFDISHTAGTDPVASMVVFEEGKPAKKQYRRFRIKTAGNDDYASMKEVITRRFARGLKEREEGKTDGFARFPDLLVIDGGKGQLHVALEALHDLGIYEGDEIMVCGLAERLEEIWMPDCDTPILLETGTAALHLLQRLRDEAHRFAITYHRSLRQKTALFSILDQIEGMGPKRKKILFEHFVSLEAIRCAALEELQAVKGIDKRSAQAVFDYFQQQK